MCGIVAEHGGSDSDELERMLERIAHRGPDDRGHDPRQRELARAPRGCRSSTSRAASSRSRPSTTTRSSSATARSTTTSTCWSASRAATSSRPPTTRSRCTCSTSSAREALHRLNGMFAFVMATEDGRFVAARDPVGIKPLYWAQQRRAAHAVRLGDARLRPRVAAASGAVPARLRLDAGGRAGQVRLRRARGPRAAPRGHRPAGRHARGAGRRRRAPDDGRRARRRVPLRRAGLLAWWRPSRPAGRPARAPCCTPSRSAPRTRPT